MLSSIPIEIWITLIICGTICYSVWLSCLTVVGIADNFYKLISSMFDVELTNDDTTGT